MTLFLRFTRAALMWIAALLLSGLPASTAVAQSLIFRSSIRTSAAGSPVAIDVADINGDGSVDAVVAVADGAANIFLNEDNDGNLRRCGAAVSLLGTPGAVLLDHFDADPVFDLVATEASHHRLRSFTGMVEGTGCNDMGFVEVPDVDVATELNPSGLASAFLDQDDDLDLVVANRGPETGDGSIMILRGEGDGHFTLIPQPAAGGGSTNSLMAGGDTRAVAIADLNGDSFEDLLAVNTGENTLATFFGLGDGTFEAGESWSTGRGPFSIVTAMLDQDENADVVVADRNEDTVSIFLGDGDGSFATRRAYPAGIFPEAIASGDMDGDGFADVVTANRGSFDVTILFGDGTGNLSAGRHFLAEEEPTALVLADLGGPDGGPGRLDAFAITASGSVTSLMNRGDGTLAAVENLPVDDVPSGIAVADLNDDALPDLIVPGETGTVTFLLARSSGGFEAGGSLPVGGHPSGVVAVDLDRDGRIDVAIADRARDQVLVAFGRGGGDFTEQESFATASQPVAIAAGDFNADGRFDLALASGDESGQVSVLLQTASRQFLPARNTEVGEEPVAIVSGGFDADDYDDLVVANNASATVVVLQSMGNGSFRQTQVLEDGAIPANPLSLAIADFDADGTADLAVGGVGTLGSSVTVSFGNGDATFEPLTGLPLGQVAVALMARDLSGDGIADLAAVTPANQLVVAVSRGDRGFRTRPGDRVSRMPIAAAAGDFDGDGRYDVVTANNAATSRNVSVLWNCAREPGCVTRQQVPGETALRGDGNGDGRRSAADLVALNAELGDGDGRDVEGIARPGAGGFAAAQGVDANGDGRVDALDRRATLQRLFAS